MAKKKAGRKSKWELLQMDKKLVLIEKWLSDNRTEKSIYESLGVGHNTWNEWKNDPSKKEFQEVLRRTKEFKDATVENTLFKRILGYEIQEEDITVDEEGSVVERKIKRRVVNPSDSLIQFYLKTQMSDKYNVPEKQEISHSGGVDFKNVSTEELQERLKKLRGE